jgi:hypothetical protein
MRSGVEMPEGKEEGGGAREWVDCEGEWGEGAVVKEDWCVGESREEEDGFGVAFRERAEEEVVPIVVLRCMLVVSAEGGGGRFVGSAVGERVEARQRKHSPVPK